MDRRSRPQHDLVRVRVTVRATARARATVRVRARARVRVSPQHDQSRWRTVELCPLHLGRVRDRARVRVRDRARVRVRDRVGVGVRVRVRVRGPLHRLRSCSVTRCSPLLPSGTTSYTSMLRSCPPHATSPPAYSPLPGANLTSSTCPRVAGSEEGRAVSERWLGERWLRASGGSKLRTRFPFSLW